MTCKMQCKNRVSGQEADIRSRTTRVCWKYLFCGDASAKAAARTEGRAGVHTAQVNQRRQVRIGGRIARRARERGVRHVTAHKVPAMQRRAQQRVDEVGAAAHVQHPHGVICTFRA